jgi:hypothetical protein
MIADALDDFSGIFCCMFPFLWGAIALVSHLDKVEKRKMEEERVRQQADATAYQEEMRRQQQWFAAQAERQEQEERRRQEETARLARAKAIDIARQQSAERSGMDPAAAGLAERDQRMKYGQLSAEHPGRVLWVSVLAWPTGYVAFDWMLDPRFACPLRVQCIRDGQLLFVEYAHRGSFFDIVSRGRDHVYIFHAYDGKRDEEPDFSFVVRIPTEKQWARKVPGHAPDDEATRAQRVGKKIEAVLAEEDLWAKAREKGHAIIGAGGGSDTELQKRRKAALDAKLIQEREREEGSGT